MSAKGRRVKMAITLCYNRLMRDGRIRVLLWLSVTTIALLLIAWVALPTILSALPGRVRQYLPADLAVQEPPPLPTLAAVSPAHIEFAPTGEADQPIMPVDLAVTLTPVPLLQPTTEAALTAVFVEATPAPVSTPAYPSRVYLDGVKIIPQKFNNCGPTNLAMVLNFHQDPSDQFTIATVVRPNYEDRNVSPDELADYVHDFTELAATVVEGGNLDLLKELLAAGLPIIIEQGLLPEGDVGWMGHYLTLYGYDEADQAFYSRDSFLGPWQEDGRESYEDVTENWRMFNNVMVVVYPSDRQAEIDAVLGPTFTDQQAMWENSAAQARDDIRKDPANPYGWFNLGTSLTELYEFTGDPTAQEQAPNAFDKARQIGLPARMLWYQFAPYDAYRRAGRIEDVLALAEATLGSQGGRSVEETYIYRALALRDRGDIQGAAGDLWRAELLNPGNPILLRAKETQP